MLANLLNALLGGGLGLGGLGGAVPLAATGASAASIPETNASFSRLSISGAAEDESATAAAGSETTPGATEGEGQVVKEPAGAKDEAKDETVEEPAAEKNAAAEEPVTEQAAEESEPAAEESTGPKHAKPDEDAQPAAEDSTPKHAKSDEDGKPGADTSSTDTGTGTTTEKKPKHAKPSLNVVRDSANASSPQDAKPSEKAGTPESGKKDDAAGATGAGSAGDSSTGGASSNAA